MSAKGLKLCEIAEMIEGQFHGAPDQIISSISAPDNPMPGSISPLWEKKFISSAHADAVLLTKPGWIREGGRGVEVEDPRKALVTLLKYFDPCSDERPEGIHPSSVISPDASIGKNVSVGPCCIIGAGASIGDDCLLHGNVWIGVGASVGDGSVIEPGAVIYDRVSIGRNCIIHANAVIGCDGFGFMPDQETGLLRIPQIGTVRVDDNVEIGVCSSIDRATFGETRISRGTKIDSHVKVGHNCFIGEFCIVVAQSGVAGSSTIGNGVVLAAQSGVANHANIGDGVTAAGRAGVASDIPAGQVVSGFPAREHRLELRQQAAMRQLPELVKNVRELGARVSKLETHS